MFTNIKQAIFQNKSPQSPFRDWGGSKRRALVEHFPRIGSVRKGAARIVFPPPKVGVTQTEPYWVVLVSQYSFIGGTETPERVPASSSYTRAPLIGRQNRTSVRQGDINKQTHYPRVKTPKASFIEKDVAQKFAVLFGRPTLLLFVRCVLSSAFLFPWIYWQATLCRAAMRSRCLRSCCGYVGDCDTCVRVQGHETLRGAKIGKDYQRIRWIQIRWLWCHITLPSSL